MLGLWRVFNARRAATAVLGPLVTVTRNRLGAIPEHVWRDPYVVGFVSMLISLIATKASQGRMNSEQLGLTQLEAWADITGVQDDQIGQQICLLSSNRDPAFTHGCANAQRFLDVYDGARPETDDMPDTALDLSIADLSGDHIAAFGAGGALAAALWRRYFEDMIH